MGSKAVFIVSVLLGLFLLVSARHIAQETTQADYTKSVEKSESRVNPEYYGVYPGYGGFSYGGYYPPATRTIERKTRQTTDDDVANPEYYGYGGIGGGGGGGYGYYGRGGGGY